MNHDISIAHLISKKVLRVFATSTLVQILLLIVVMAYLSYNDARTRSNFLANSNNDALGLMISTGDLFQIKNTLNSYRSEKTPFVWILDENDESITRAVDTELLFSKSPKEVISFTPQGILLLTSHEIQYNNQKVGKLLLANKILFSDWLIVGALLLGCAAITFFIQGKTLEKTSLELGRSLNELEKVYENSNTEVELESFYSNRKSSRIAEIENFATKTKFMLSKIIRSSNLEREAAIGRISAQLTHDMRAPIGTFERLLLAQDEELPKMRGAVRESVNRLYTMVDALRHGEVENIVRKALTQIDFEFGYESLTGKAKSKNLTLIVPKESIDKVYVDKEKFERTWINLASNAIEFAKTKVEVKVLRKNSDLYIRVEDDGPGVPDEFLPKLFQRGATFGKSDGTGLGLAFVKQIIQGHGGDVSYAREDGITVFECYFPDAFADINPADDSHPVPEQNLTKEIKQRPRIRVAICLEPPILTKDVLSRLSKEMGESTAIELLTDRETAAIVVSNQDEIMFEVLERDDQEYLSVAQFKNDVDAIVTILMRKFE